jgi:excisionase family DNA binding protein
MSKQVRVVLNTMPPGSSDSRSFKPNGRDVPRSKKAVVQTSSASADSSPERPPGTNVEIERCSAERAYGVQTEPRTDAGRGLVRVEEAARRLGLGRTKAWELVYSGALHSVTIGRSRRVPISSLHAFVQRLVEHGSA